MYATDVKYTTTGFYLNKCVMDGNPEEINQ